MTVSASGFLEFCENEYFEASCSSAGEVIVMQSARYGRMEQNRCIERSFGFIGCHSNVLHLTDRECSGRPACRIPVPNANFNAETDCPRDLKPYLEASYACVAVDTGRGQSCKNSKPITPSTPHGGYFSSFVTQHERTGECILYTSTLMT